MDIRRDIELFYKRGHEIKPQAASYEGAATLRGPLAGWHPLSASADGHLLPELETLRNRSYDLVRNEGLISGAMQTFVDNIIGPSLRLNSAPNWRALGWERDRAKAWAREVEARFSDYAESTDCDASRRHTLGEMAALAFREVFASGDALALPMWRPGRPGASAATCMRLVESDRLCNPDHRQDGLYLRGGVELNHDGEHVAYHVRKHHPGDGYLGGTWAEASNTWLRIPARTAWGRPRALQLANIHRIGQNRGQTFCASVISETKMLGQYQKTELQAAIVNALIAAFIETPLGPEALAELFQSAPSPDDLSVTPADSLFDARNQRRGAVRMEGGAVVPLYPGEKLSSFAPGRPMTAYRDYIKTLEDILGVGLGVSRLTLTKDASEVNYSSGRMALMGDWKFFSGRRSWLGSHFFQPAYELWLEEQVGQGLIDAPGFYKNQRAYSRARWIGPGRGWIDPVKETKAAILRIKNQISTLQVECAEQGLDWEEVLEQRAAELKYWQDLAEKYGLDLGADPEGLLAEPDEPAPGNEDAP